MHAELPELPEVRNGPPPWLITFADLMVLLMCFFVLMLSFSEMDAEKFKIMSGSLNEAFGVQTDVTAADAPKGTSLEANEFSPAIPEPTAVNEVRQHTVDSDLNTLDLGLELRLQELKAQEEAAAKQAQELRAVFSQEIDDGKLLIRQDGSNVVIQLLEKDSFPSGSAALEPGSLASLAKVGALVRGMTGAITVAGHTDNVPIRNGGQYRSNWELSAARAASVGHELLAAGLEPTRLMVSGHADTQPRAANDTAANRALNRRVDITFANGRDRPGVWTRATADAPPAR
ncbi:MAG TPA: MotB family protein [Gammaproteobacteria bacterium]|nr:MotB family protein [Gammaproteobacteria bacterium]